MLVSVESIPRMWISIDDSGHTTEDIKFMLLGRSINDQPVVVVHVERGDQIRLVSASRATKRERKSMSKELPGEMRDEYDFSKGHRGKYADEYMRRSSQTPR